MAAAEIDVSWADEAAYRAAPDLLAMLDCCRLGRLTTEHAASSCGLPVVVGLDGAALGPADLPAGAVLVASRLNPAIDDGGSPLLPLTPAEWALVEAARAAGYVVEVRE